MNAPNRTERIWTRVRPHEKELIERAAAAARKPKAEYMRDILLEDARRRLDASQPTD